MVVHLPLSPSYLLNFLISSSPQLITSHFHLPLSPSHPLNSLTSSSPQLITPPISSLNPVLRFFLVSLWSLWFYCCLNLKSAFFPLWFLIDFTGFHAFIYLFIWFHYSAQFFFGFWCFFFRWFYACLHAQIEIVFLRTIGTQSSTGTPLFCLALNTKPFRIVPVIPSENIFRPGIFTICVFFFFFLNSNQDSKAKNPSSLFVLYL
jgi:hypothetical protein